jgi:hypothetical protein
MSWVLLILMFSSTGHIQTRIIEFKTEQACKSAADEIMKAESTLKDFRVDTFCYDKRGK